LKTDEKTDAVKVQKIHMVSGKISLQNRKQLTKKLTKTHLKRMRSPAANEKGPAPFRTAPSKT